MKKLCVIFYLIFALIAVSACQSSPSPQTTSNKASTSDQQLSWLSENSNSWYHDELDDGFSPLGITVTDLDQDGLLEIITATLQGTGLYTYVEMFEMTPSLDALKPLPLSDEDFLNFPDIIENETTSVYYDEAKNEYHYIFHDFIRNGASEHFEFTTALTLSGDVPVLTPLALRHELYTQNDSEDEPIEQITYEALAPGFETMVLSQEADYNAVAETVYGDLFAKQATFVWQMKEETPFTELDSETLFNLLKTCFKGFSVK